MDIDFENLNTIANDECSSVFLTDENLCLNDSRIIFNTNFDALSSNAVAISRYGDQLYGVYTAFSNNSARWLNSYTNIQQLSASLNNVYTTCYTLSSFWEKPFELIYPNIINQAVWYANIAAYKTYIQSWLHNNFPETSYEKNQNVVVSVNLINGVSFAASFYRTYYESCTTSVYSAIQCQGCYGKFSISCNFFDAAMTTKIPGCDFCNLCDVTPNWDLITEVIPCATYGQGNLVLNYNRQVSDSFVNRVVKVNYKNINNSWTIQ